MADQTDTQNVLHLLTAKAIMDLLPGLSEGSMNRNAFAMGAMLNILLKEKGMPRKHALEVAEILSPLPKEATEPATRNQMIAVLSQQVIDYMRSRQDKPAQY